MKNPSPQSLLDARLFAERTLRGTPPQIKRDLETMAGALIWAFDKLHRDASLVVCGWCDERQLCRRPPRGDEWARRPICRNCYRAACDVDRIAKPVPWAKLKPWGAP